MLKNTFFCTLWLPEIGIRVGTCSVTSDYAMGRVQTRHEKSRYAQFFLPIWKTYFLIQIYYTVIFDDNWLPKLSWYLTLFFLSKHTYSLFRKKRFEINFFVWQNASKFAIFIEKENPHTFFRFSFRAFLNFTLWMPRSMST